MYRPRLPSPMTSQSTSIPPLEAAHWDVRLWRHRRRKKTSSQHGARDLDDETPSVDSPTLDCIHSVITFRLGHVLCFTSLCSDVIAAERERQSRSSGPQNCRISTDSNQTAIEMCWRVVEDKYLVSDPVCTQAYAIQFPHTTPSMNMQAGGDEWLKKCEWNSSSLTPSLISHTLPLYYQHPSVMITHMQMH